MRELPNTESQNKVDFPPVTAALGHPGPILWGTRLFHHTEESRAGLVLSMGSWKLS